MASAAYELLFTKRFTQGSIRYISHYSEGGVVGWPRRPLIPGVPGINPKEENQKEPKEAVAIPGSFPGPNCIIL